MPKTTAKPSQSDRKAAWAARSDRGPHTATLPSGQDVLFIVPDSNALVRADMLPERLMDLAVFAAAYPDGADGYLADLAINAMRDPGESQKLAKAFKDGLELRDWLVAHMLVDPAVSPEEVGEGLFPAPDIEMLLDFAERRRNTDAEGKVLPIIVLEEFARFRGELGGGADAGAGGSNGDVVPVADAAAGGGAV